MLLLINLFTNNIFAHSFHSIYLLILHYLRLFLITYNLNIAIQNIRFIIAKITVRNYIPLFFH
jgi:hypothetical protein